jgi:hypothetical protein
MSALYDFGFGGRRISVRPRQAKASRVELLSPIQNSVPKRSPETSGETARFSKVFNA